MSLEHALLVDYEFCLGCCDCETACMSLPNKDPESSGIHIIKYGPWKTADGSWQYDFIPFPTDWCDLCKSQNTKRKRPACVKHCAYGVLSYGTIDELVQTFKSKSKTMLFTPKNA